MSIGLQTVDEGGTSKDLTYAEKQNYKYYYMLIRQEDFINENTALLNGTWKGGEDLNGSYNIENDYIFTLSEFVNSSFYGYLAFSVCN